MNNFTPKKKVRALWSDAEPGIFSGIVLGVDRVRGEVRVRYSDGDEKTVRAEYILCRSGSGSGSRSGGGDTTATILPSSASERESSGGGPATDSPRTAAVSAAASADASGSAALAFGDT